MADDLPYLTVGTEVTAKKDGAICEATIRKVIRAVKCEVTFKAESGSYIVPDDQINGTIRVGANVDAKHPDKNQFLEATINKLQDCSQYTVVFDRGGITTMMRSALCLKGGRPFKESETLNQLPLTNPEHSSNPVVGGRRGVRRKAPNNDADKEEDECTPPTKRDGRRKRERELGMGKVVSVESMNVKKRFPALVASPSAQDTVKIRTKDEYLVKSFRDGRYYIVPKNETTEFTKDSSSEYDLPNTAVDKALLYLEKNELPPHWDREGVFGNVNQSENGGDDQQSESESEHSEDDQRYKVPASPVADSPVQIDTGTGSESEVKKDLDSEPRRSRGRQPKKDVAEVAAASASPSPPKKKRQTTTSKERDSSVASSKDDDGGSAPPTSTNTSTTTKKGVGRGKKPIVPPAEPTPPPKMMDFRLGDTLEVYYPKSEGKTHEAKVIDIKENNESVLVHYNGKSQRYDEWIHPARVSKNISLKMEATREVGTGAKTTNPANPEVAAKGMGKRKGRKS